jgi:hypothetical protein
VGGERESIQIFLQEPAYVLSSSPIAKTLEKGDEHTKQQCRNDPHEVMNAVAK